MLTRGFPLAPGGFLTRPDFGHVAILPICYLSLLISLWIDVTNDVPVDFGLGRLELDFFENFGGQLVRVKAENFLRIDLWSLYLGRK